MFAVDRIWGHTEVTSMPQDLLFLDPGRAQSIAEQQVAAAKVIQSAKAFIHSRRVCEVLSYGSLPWRIQIWTLQRFA